MPLTNLHCNMCRVIILQIVQSYRLGSSNILSQFAKQVLQLIVWQAQGLYSLCYHLTDTCLSLWTRCGTADVMTKSMSLRGLFQESIRYLV